MERRTVATILILTAVIILLSIGAGSVPLLDPDEARFARTSVEMLRTQDPVVPQFQGQPRLVKPPLMHWIQSSLFRVFGVGERVARLHALVATLGSLLLIGAIARRRFGAEAGLWAMAILATMPLVAALGRIGTLDALLSVHVLAIWALDLMAPPEESHPYRAWAMGALMGLAFLVKGPVGVVLPMLMILTGRTLAKRDVLPSLVGAGKALLAGCLVVLPWGLAFANRVQWGTVMETLETEALGRFYAGADHHNPVWFYIPVLIVGLMPWIGPLLVGLVRVIKQRSEPGTRTALYATAGLLSGVVFFSIAKSRLPSYVLPLAPAAALVVIWQLGQELEDPRRRRAGSWALVIALGLFAVILGVAATRLDEPEFTQLGWIGAGLYGAGLIAAVVGALRCNPRQVYGTAAATSFAFLILLMVGLLPQLGRTQSAADLVDAVPELRAGQQVFVVDMKVPSLTFYLDMIPESVDMAHLEDRMSVAPRGLLVFDEDDYPNTPSSVERRLTPIGSQGKYRVFQLSATLRQPDSTQNDTQ